MKSISIWKFKNYKAYLKSWISSPNAPKGALSRLAEAAGCQPSYLSQVLNSKVQLTPDQGFGIANYFDLSASESEYFFTMIDHARATTSAWRVRLEKKMLNLANEAQNSGDRLRRSAVELTEHQATYYSSWTWIAIHIALAISAFQTEDALARRLNLERDLVRSQLEEMEKMGLVRHEGGRWYHSGAEVHLRKNSPFVSQHLGNWRQRAILKSQLPNTNANVLFSGVYALSSADFAQLKEYVLDVIAHINKTAAPSVSEELVCFNCDLFSI